MGEGSCQSTVWVQGSCQASASRYRDPRPGPRGLVPKLASSRDRGPTISEVDRQLEHEHDSPHITARA